MFFAYFVTALFPICWTESTVPFNVTNLRVDAKGLVGVTIVIQTTNTTIPQDDLEIFFQDEVTRNITKFSLLNLTMRKDQENLLLDIPGLEQDTYYSCYLQANGTIVSSIFTLVTTGLQSIGVQSESMFTSVICEFLPGSFADGCLLEWNVKNSSIKLTGSIMIQRQSGKDLATGRLESLMPETSYEIHGFGLRRNIKLHAFPILLQGGFSTGSTQTVPISESDTLPIVLSAVLSATLMGAVLLGCAIVVSVIKCHRRKIEGGDTDNSDDIQVSHNICYGGIFDVKEPSQADAESLHLYDDIVALHQSATLLNYENVDPSTGLPIIPRPVSTSIDLSTTSDHCERATLPLEGANFKKVEVQKRRDKAPLERAQTFKHEVLHSYHSDVPRRGVSCTFDVADYEIPIKITDV